MVGGLYAPVVPAGLLLLLLRIAPETGSFG